MKRYIITSPAFTGEVGVLYGSDHRLQFVDFTKAQMSNEQIAFFKEHVPVELDATRVDEHTEIISTSFGRSRLSVVGEGYHVTFEMWWKRYNIKRNKGRCEQLWSKMTEAERVNAYFKLGSYERHLQLNTWKTKAEPDTYLRKRYYENDYTK